MHKRSLKGMRITGQAITYIILITAVIICLFPFVWMVSTAFKETSEIYKMPRPYFHPDFIWIILLRAGKKLILGYTLKTHYLLP